MLYNTECIKPEDFKPQRFESDHEITLRGKKIPYHTVSEDNVFYSKDGKPEASIFSYSYFRSDVKDTRNRPVCFAYNGGPGSGSYFVHAGFLAPRRVVYGEPDRPTAFGPYEVQDNPDFLLDDADLVICDAIGTGNGMLIDEDKKADYLGIEQDGEAFIAFIERWLKKYNRTMSPKYLIGESYGCTRNATIVGIGANGGRERSYGVSFDGVVNIGNTITVGKYFGEGLYVEPSVIGFPTYAGVNWYHHRPTNQTVKEFVMEAKKFADTEYMLALYKGESLSDEEKAHIIDKVTYYTGVSKEYLIRNGLKIDDDNYRQEVLKKEGKAVSRYDGRMTRPLAEPEVFEAKHNLFDDATADRYETYFYAVETGEIFPDLNIKMDRPYITSHSYWKNWDKEEKMGVTGLKLRDAMTRRPGMRTFFANGWFDLCTEFGYVFHTLDHAGLPKDRTFVKGYNSGHMIYIGEDNVKELSADIRTFILGGDPTKG